MCTLLGPAVLLASVLLASVHLWPHSRAWGARVIERVQLGAALVDLDVSPAAKPRGPQGTFSGSFVLRGGGLSVFRRGQLRPMGCGGLGITLVEVKSW